MGVCYSLLWAACYPAIVTASHTGFRRMSQTSRWCVTLCCRLLVILRLLWLVILVFEECLELHGGVLLFAVERLVILRLLRLVVLVSEYCFVVHAYRTASGCFLAVNWVVGVIQKKFSLFPTPFYLMFCVL